MSRFFETLKEVSRSQMDAAVTPANPPAGKPGRVVAQEHVPAADPPVAVGTSPDTPLPETPRVELPSVKFPNPASHEAFFETMAPRRNGFSGAKTVRFALDRTESLLPNATGGVVVERYRRLRSKLQQENATKEIKSLLVTSPAPGEGKTITTLNLAYSFGMLPNFKVLVIDGDLRRGKIAHTLGVENTVGLSNVLDRSARLDDVVLRSDEAPFSFIVSGASETPAAELLTSPVLQQVIREMTQHFDLILVDSPPVNLFADAQSLAGGCDGVLIVARAFTTTNKALEKTLHDLLPFRIVGTVLNGGSAPERTGYKYKGYSRADA